MTSSNCPWIPLLVGGDLLLILYTFKKNWRGNGRGTGPSVHLDAHEGRILLYTRKAWEKISAAEKKCMVLVYFDVS